ncbi:hypothetical protein HanRHA438_Chr01g0026611 [Helianthus annuus]|nr:hypothetical protein HanRHA438_Chr01g0026611 [Helianthus annuus]
MHLYSSLGIVILTGFIDLYFSPHHFARRWLAYSHYSLAELELDLLNLRPMKF